VVLLRFLPKFSNNSEGRKGGKGERGEKSRVPLDGPLRRGAVLASQGLENAGRKREKGGEREKARRICLSLLPEKELRKGGGGREKRRAAQAVSPPYFTFTSTKKKDLGKERKRGASSCPLFLTCRIDWERKRKGRARWWFGEAPRHGEKDGRRGEERGKTALELSAHKKRERKDAHRSADSCSSA